MSRLDYMQIGKLGKLRVFELRKYLAHQHIRLPGTNKMDTVKHISEHLDSQRREPWPSTNTSDSILSDESPDYDLSNSEDYLVARALDNSETVVGDQHAKYCIKS